MRAAFGIIWSACGKMNERPRARVIITSSSDDKFKRMGALFEAMNAAIEANDIRLALRCPFATLTRILSCSRGMTHCGF